MKIQLKGELDLDLRVIGLKPGQIIEDAGPSLGFTNPVYFDHRHNGHKYNCVVWPENYEIIEN